MSNRNLSNVNEDNHEEEFRDTFFKWVTCQEDPVKRIVVNLFARNYSVSMKGKIVKLYE